MRSEMNIFFEAENENRLVVSKVSFISEVAVISEYVSGRAFRLKILGES